MTIPVIFSSITFSAYFNISVSPQDSVFSSLLFFLALYSLQALIYSIKSPSIPVSVAPFTPFRLLPAPFHLVPAKQCRVRASVCLVCLLLPFLRGARTRAPAVLWAPRSGEGRGGEGQGTRAQQERRRRLFPFSPSIRRSEQGCRRRTSAQGCRSRGG